MSPPRSNPPNGKLRLLLSSHGASGFGAERVLLILAEGLAGRGLEVTLEVPHDGPMLDAAQALDGVDIWRSNRPRLPRTLGEAARYVGGLPSAVARLRRRMQNGAYDAAWVNSLFNPPAALAARLAGVGVVWHLHERRFRGPAGPPSAWFVRACAHEPVAVSEFVGRTFEKTPGVRGFQVLYEQFTPLDPMPLPGDGPFTVGYLGQFEPRKRVPDLVRAIAAEPDVHGLLVGAGKREHEVRAVIDDLGVADRVDLPGFQEDVTPWYARMHCVVIPSRDEPCPLVALEAMSTGRPVIASNHGGHPEVLGDAGLLYPLGDIDALRTAIRRLRDDPEVRQELARRAVKRAASFDRNAWLDRAETLARAATRKAGRIQ